jgi:hypothetical protein
MNTLVTVPNGTEIASPTYVALVTKYRTFAKQTAENIIRLAETLVEAKGKLQAADFLKFCAEVGLEHDGSTFRKLMKIGNEASRFEPFFEQMPNNWTTVYRLATLEKNVFERVTSDPRFAPMMTASDVDLIIRGPSASTERLSRDWTIDLSPFDRSKKIEVSKKLADLVQQFGLRCAIGANLAKQIEPKEKPNLLEWLVRAA